MGGGDASNADTKLEPQTKNDDGGDDAAADASASNGDDGDEVVFNTLADGRGFHFSTSQLNLSRFYHQNHPTHPTQSAYVEPKSGRV